MSTSGPGGRIGPQHEAYANTSIRRVTLPESVLRSWKDGPMTWSAPSVEHQDGSPTAPETELLPGVLDWHRAGVPIKCAGLTGEQLAFRPLPFTTLTLRGLVRHLAKVERTWFRIRLLGEDVPMLYSTPDRKDADFEDLDPARAEHDYAVLLDEQATAR